MLPVCHVVFIFACMMRSMYIVYVTILYIYYVQTTCATTRTLFQLARLTENAINNASQRFAEKCYIQCLMPCYWWCCCMLAEAVVVVFILTNWIIRSLLVWKYVVVNIVVLHVSGKRARFKPQLKNNLFSFDVLRCAWTRTYNVHLKTIQITIGTPYRPINAIETIFFLSFVFFFSYYLNWYVSTVIRHLLDTYIFLFITKIDEATKLIAYAYRWVDLIFLGTMNRYMGMGTQNMYMRLNGNESICRRWSN